MGHMSSNLFSLPPMHIDSSVRLGIKTLCITIKLGFQFRGLKYLLGLLARW